MQEATLCFLVRGEPYDEVLLGLKKVGFGAGKLVGIGGKIEVGATAVASIIRELREEIHIQASPNDLQKAGTLTFLFPHKPAWSQQVQLFRLEKWVGTPRESAEMRPHWFNIKEIPLAKMWQDSRYWLPLMLDGHNVQATFTFAADNETVVTSEVEAFSEIGPKRGQRK